MKFSISRENFLQPLQLVSGAVERRHTLPILSNVLIKVSDNALWLTGTDLEVELISNVTLTGELEEGEITVPAKKLLDIIQPKKLRSLILDEIEFNGKESVQTRKALFKLVKHHATNLSFYYDAGSSGGFFSSRFEMISNSKTSIQCYRCKGNHKRRDCKDFSKYEGNQ